MTTSKNTSKNAKPAAKAAAPETAQTHSVENAVAPEQNPAAPHQPSAEQLAEASRIAEASGIPASPELAEDGMSAKMPEGHTVHFEKSQLLVDPNLRMTVGGTLLTSNDDQTGTEA